MEERDLESLWKVYEDSLVKNAREVCDEAIVPSASKGTACLGMRLREL